MYLKMPTIVAIILGFLLCGAASVDGAKILGVVHFPSKSHHILVSSLLKALAGRGHQVTMLSAFPLKTPLRNYEDIELTGMLNFAEGNLTQTLVQMQNASFLEKMTTMTKQMDQIDTMFLSHTAVKELMGSNRKFDLVIQPWFGNDAYLALAHYLGAQAIPFSTIGSYSETNKLTGNTAPFAYVPNLMPGFPDEMNFLQRVGNTLSYVAMDLFRCFYMAQKQELLLQEYFPKAPPITELLSNISLVLLNSHYSIESPRPYVPSMIQVGGLHLQEPKELKGDLKEFMDSAAEGVILFSLGSNVRSSDLPKDKLKAIVSSFVKLPVKVLWKFETDDIPNVPKNVKIGKWLPQTDILAHPNLRVFVTHGGLLSTTEAIYHGVPMVGIPIFADQTVNVEDGAKKGYVVRVPFLELTEEMLTEAITEVLNNARYRENVKKRSLILRDQPLKPIDKAVFWVEYVLRHKGAHHLRTSALKLEWYQYYLLDVLALIFAVIFTAILGIVFCSCKLFRFVKVKFCKTNKGATVIGSKEKKKSKMA